MGGYRGVEAMSIGAFTQVSFRSLCVVLRSPDACLCAYLIKGTSKFRFEEVGEEPGCVTNGKVVSFSAGTIKNPADVSHEVMDGIVCVKVGADDAEISRHVDNHARIPVARHAGIDGRERSFIYLCL